MTATGETKKEHGHGDSPRAVATQLVDRSDHVLAKADASRVRRVIGEPVAATVNVADEPTETTVSSG